MSRKNAENRIVADKTSRKLNLQDGMEREKKKLDFLITALIIRLGLNTKNSAGLSPTLPGV